MSTYSKDEIIKKLEVAKSEMWKFYSQDFVIIEEKHQIKKGIIIQKLLRNGYWIISNYLMI